MSPELLRRALMHYGPPGLCCGDAVIRFDYPHDAPIEHQRTLWAHRNRTIIRGMSTLIPGGLRP